MSNETSVNANNICGLCNEKSSKYCCPRCEVYYCSLDCYKSEIHIKCSESFYRDCVNEELASQNVDAESKRKMIEILKRMQNDGADDPNIDLLGNPEDYEEESVDSDDENDIDLEERVKDLNLDDPAALWGALTEDERNEFEALLNQGDVGSLIPHWRPWWLYRKTVKLIQDLEDKNRDNENDALKKCPSLIDVPKFSSLTSVQPSPAIRFNITNVLSSYAFIMRYFNGDVDAVESTAYLLSICDNLDSNTNFEDFETAVEAVAQKCLQSNLIETDSESLDIMKNDTCLILQGPSADNKHFYCKSALSNVFNIFSKAKSTGKIINKEKIKNNTEFSRKFPEHSGEHYPNIDASKVKKCMKKVEFYLSFIDTHGMDFE